MRNFRQSPLILLIGGIAGIFLLLSLSRTAPENRSLKLDPYTAKMQLAFAYMQPGQGQKPLEGVKLYRKLVTQFPKRFEAAFQLGTMAMETRQYYKASGWFEKAAKAASTNDSKTICLLNWSDALYMKNNADSALLILNEALKYTRSVEVVNGIQKRINELKKTKH
jgi:tetratricopeptide (TPR) repeat protein